MNQRSCMQQLKDREYELQVLREVGESIVAETNLPQLLQLVANKARELIGAETLMIPLLNQTREQYVYAAASGKDAESIVGTTFPVRIGMCGWVLRNKRPMLYGESSAWPMDEITHWEQGQVSALLVPLISQNKIIGGLSGTGKAGGKSFTTRDMELLTLFSHQVSVAIENARLFQEIQQAMASLEQRVQSRTQELELANQELAAFSYSVSHDLRAPLRSIDGFSQALLEDYGAHLDEEGQGYLERLRANALRMGELIDAMLMLSRVTRTDLHQASVDLSALALNITGKLQEAEPDRSITLDIEPGMLAYGDPALLDALLVNLFSNAWKYTGNVAHPHIKFSTTELNGKDCFCVRDNGAGFNMALADKLFKPFQRLHTAREFEGTGVGLATVQRIINRHGGWIHAEGATGHGAAFFFKLARDDCNEGANES